MHSKLLYEEDPPVAHTEVALAQLTSTTQPLISPPRALTRSNTCLTTKLAEAWGGLSQIPSSNRCGMDGSNKPPIKVLPIIPTHEHKLSGL